VPSREPALVAADHHRREGRVRLTVRPQNVAGSKHKSVGTLEARLCMAISASRPWDIKPASLPVSDRIQSFYAASSVLRRRSALSGTADVITLKFVWSIRV
jgi:hypothetical protein